MIDNAQNQDKRRHQRFEKKLPIKFKAGNFDIVTETKNISLSGLYCQTDRYIEPLTKIQLTMLLPHKQKNGRVTSVKIITEAVVVRCSPSNNNLFDVALYFIRITKANLQKINRYIKEHCQSIV